MLHALVLTWFGWVRDWGYTGVFVLMAMESTIFPVPSELVMPPAAFWAAQGKMNFWGVVLAGTLGSYFGSALSYWVFRVVGKPFLTRFGKFLLLNPDKVLVAERWIAEFGPAGVFLARLLPVIRHLISIPAGLFKMNFSIFSLVTLTGAGLWCYVLSWWGETIIGKHPELLDSPEQMMHTVRTEMSGLILAILALTALYSVVIWFRRKRPQGSRVYTA